MDVAARAARGDAATPTVQVADAYGTATPPSVIVRDSAGQPLRGALVRFTSSSPAGDSVVQTRTTDSLGIATLSRWALDLPSTYRTIARTGQLPPVTFTAVAVPAFLRADVMRQKCPLSDSLRTPFTGLDSTLARLRSDRPVTIVAYGSSSTVGEGASRPELGYVDQTASQLRRAFPRATITMINAGVTGASASMMDARVDTAVLRHTPQLVIVQAATIEAIRGMPLDSLRLPIARLLQKLRARGIEVLMLDSQRFRGFGGGPEYRAFQNELRLAGAAVGASTARRFLWYDEMLNQQVYTYDQLLAADYLHPTDLGHECTATVLTTGIVAAMLGGTAP